MSRALPLDTSYRGAGVDTDAAEAELRPVIEQIKAAWPKEGIGAVRLDERYFANVIEVAHNLGVAICTDGVGSKCLIAQMMRKYDTIGIDCVAMNVNDLICVGAKPLTFVDYIAVEEVQPGVIREILEGLYTGTLMAGVTLSGGETAQLPDIIRGASPKHGFDLAGTAIGTVALDEMLIGRDLKEGDVVIGIESNGIHSNGLSLARKIFFKELNYNIDKEIPGLDTSLGEELIKPTHIYVKEVNELLGERVPVKAAIHVTSDGFMNLTRVASKVGYVLDSLPDVPPVFKAIHNHGDVTVEEMFSVYNMGVGFCLIVDKEAVESVISLVQGHAKRAWRIGYVTEKSPGKVAIPRYDIMPYGVEGWGKHFHRA